MLKHTGLSNKWEKRWFVLEGGFLKYFYEREGHGVNALPKGVLPMSSYTAHDGDDELQRRNCLILKPLFPGDHEYRLSLESAFQKRTWLAKLGAGSHTGRVKCMVVGPEGVGKSGLTGTFLHSNPQQVELQTSRPSHGSHVGYVPAPEGQRKDLVMHFPGGGESVVSLECVENPGRGDWDHVRQMTYRGTDVVLAVFSVADRRSLADLERSVQVEAKKLSGGAPIILVGTKLDLREGRLAEPVVGHASPGSRGHLTPRQRQEFNCVSFLEGKEAAARMGAAQYIETCMFDQDGVDAVFAAAAQHGLTFRTPLSTENIHKADTSPSRDYQMYSRERSDDPRDYTVEPRRSKDRMLELPAEDSAAGEW